MFHKVNLGIIRNKISEVNCGKNAKCRKYILNIKSTYNQLPTIFFPRSKTSRSGAYFVPETGRLVAKFPATMTICTPRATAFVRKTDENFTNWSKKFEPAAEGRRIFFNVQLSFPNFWHRKMAVGSQQWPGTNVAEVAHSPRQRHSVTNLSVHLIEDSEDSKTHALCVKWSK